MDQVFDEWEPATEEAVAAKQEFEQAFGAYCAAIVAETYADDVANWRWIAAVVEDIHDRVVPDWIRKVLPTKHGVSKETAMTIASDLYHVIENYLNPGAQPPKDAYERAEGWYANELRSMLPLPKCPSCRRQPEFRERKARRSTSDRVCYGELVPGDRFFMMDEESGHIFLSEEFLVTDHRSEKGYLAVSSTSGASTWSSPGCACARSRRGGGA